MLKTHPVRLLAVSIRFSKPSDLPAISLILDETELFPSEMLNEMILPFLADLSSDEKWFVYDDNEHGVVGFGYCRAEPLTEGTWNLLAIGIRTNLQGRGIGAKMMQYIEQALSSERLLIVETSSLGSFEKTRAFYVSCGYDLVATIPGYWAENDNKVIFSKKLS